MKVGATKTGGVHLAADDLGRLEGRREEQLAVLFTEDRKIGQGSGQGRNPDDGPQHDADHGNAAAALDETVQHFPGPSQRIHAVLGSLTAAVPHGDERGFGTFGHLYDFGDFQRMHFTHASAVNAEILCKTVHTPSLDGPLTRHHTVAQRLVEEHVVVVGSMGDEGVNLEE